MCSFDARAVLGASSSRRRSGEPGDAVVIIDHSYSHGFTFLITVLGDCWLGSPRARVAPLSRHAFLGTKSLTVGQWLVGGCFNKRPVWLG